MSAPGTGAVAEYRDRRCGIVRQLLTPGEVAAIGAAMDPACMQGVALARSSPRQSAYAIKPGPHAFERGAACDVWVWVGNGRSPLVTVNPDLF